MKPEEHKQRHVELHKSLDELFADYIIHHPDESNYSGMVLQQFIRWSYEQSKNPTEEKHPDEVITS